MYVRQMPRCCRANRWVTFTNLGHVLLTLYLRVVYMLEVYVVYARGIISRVLKTERQNRAVKNKLTTVFCLLR